MLKHCVAILCVAAGLLVAGAVRADTDPRTDERLNWEVIGAVITDTAEQAAVRVSTCAKKHCAEPTRYVGTITVRGEPSEYVAERGIINWRETRKDGPFHTIQAKAMLDAAHSPEVIQPLPIIYPIVTGVVVLGGQVICSVTEGGTSRYCSRACGTCRVRRIESTCVAGYRHTECECDCSNVVPTPNPVNGMFGWGPTGGTPFLPTSSRLSGPWQATIGDPGTGWQGN